MAMTHEIHVGPEVVEKVAKAIGGPKWILDGYEVTDQMRVSAQRAITSYEGFRTPKATVIFDKAEA